MRYIKSCSATYIVANIILSVFVIIYLIKPDLSMNNVLMYSEALLIAYICTIPFSLFYGWIILVMFYRKKDEKDL